jgi:hypothetical protein
VKKKIQIFISSTYTDLINERQAAVEAILKSGNIPAGMELFAAGNKSQMETIHRWIDESDVFMLILGARYGSIETQSGKSYTQLEYEYAVNTDKPFFAVVLTETAIDRKVQEAGKGVLESDNPKLLKDFRAIVTSKICRMVDDSKDIKLAIHETLMDFIRDYEFAGWVSGREMASHEILSKQIAELSRENAQLRAKNEELQAAVKRSSENTKNPTQEYSDLFRTLRNEKVTFIHEGAQFEKSLLQWLLDSGDSFVRGVENSMRSEELELFLFYKIAPKLVIYGLIQDEKVPGVQWRRFKTTKKGNDFLAHVYKLLAENRTSASSRSTTAQTPTATEPAQAPAATEPSSPRTNQPTEKKARRKPK